MAAARLGLWCCAVLGFGVSVHAAVDGLPGYWAAALCLGAYAAWPVWRECVHKPARQRLLQVTDFGVRMGSRLPLRGAAQALAWGEVSRVELVSAGRDGQLPDLMFRLHGGPGQAVLDVPASQAAQLGLCATLEARLGPLDEAALLATLAARRSTSRTLWQRPVGRPQARGGAAAAEWEPAY